MRLKTISDAEKDVEVSRIRREHEAKLNDIIKEHRLQLQKLETANIMNQESARNTQEQSEYNTNEPVDDTGLPEKYILPTIENKNPPQGAVKDKIDENLLKLERQNTFTLVDEQKSSGRGKHSPELSLTGSGDSNSNSEPEVSNRFQFLKGKSD